MSEEATGSEPGSEPGSAPDSGESAPEPETKYAPSEASGSHAGRASSWVAVSIMVVGFVVGGVALCVGPAWVLFWAGAGIVAAGFIVGGLVHIFSDVVVDAPRVIPEIVDYSVFGSRTAKRRGGLAGETLDKPVHTDTQHTPHG